MNPVLPPPDPTPLPGPVWLFHLLQIATFWLHLIAMNLLMGGGILGSISGLRGRANVPHHRRLADRLFRLLPIVTAMTITLGVAPLLFVQLLYGRFFYTSSILVAIPWIAVIGLLCCAYYGHYFTALSDTVRRERFLWIAWISTLLVVVIGFIYTNNITLMQTPGRFWDLYVANRLGLRLNLGEPTLFPRILHFVTGAIAVAGIGSVAIGQDAQRSGEKEFGGWVVRHGTIWFAGATLVQVLVGFWFLFSLPVPVRTPFLGGDVAYTAHLFGGVFLALVAVFLLVVGGRSRAFLLAAAGMLGVAILAMVLVRHWVRLLMIGDLAGLATIPVRAQVSVLALFLACFAAALATVVWMLRRYVVEKAREPIPTV